MTVAADYSASIEVIRGHLAKGTTMTQAEMQDCLTLLKHAATKVSAMHTATGQLRTVWDAQIAILQAGGAGDISADVDTADVAIEAKVAALETADFGAVTYTTNTVMDG